MRASFRCVALLTTFPAVVGCQLLPGDDDSTRRVDTIRLVTTPTARNFDGKPGADGFLIKVYALSRAAPKAIRISDGALELSLYEGVDPELVTADVPPLKTWRYEARELEAFPARSYVGISYTLILRWDDGTPVRGDVTLVARYFASTERVLTAAPVSHTLGSR